MRASVAVAVAARRRRGRGRRGDPRRVGRRSRGLDHTVVEAAPAPATPNTPVRSAPAAGTFDPAALYAARADGVVTIYANLGADGSAQGSGFVVDRTGAILTNAHVITNVAELEPGSAAPVRAASAVYVEFSDGERVKAKIVGWDLFSDVGVIRVTPADHVLDAAPARRLPRSGRRRAGGRDRKPVREADVPLRRRRLRHRPLDRLAHLGVHGRERRSRPTRRSTGGTPAGRSSTATAA